LTAPREMLSFKSHHSRLVPAVGLTFDRSACVRSYKNTLLPGTREFNSQQPVLAVHRACLNSSLLCSGMCMLASYNRQQHMHVGHNDSSIHCAHQTNHNINSADYSRPRCTASWQLKCQTGTKDTSTGGRCQVDVSCKLPQLERLQPGQRTRFTWVGVAFLGVSLLYRTP
jgi:hypothetical protein